MSGLGNGFAQLFKGWGRGIGNAVDNFLLGADARKAISDEVGKKFQPMIDRAQRYESKRAANIKDLDNKLTQSKKDLVDAQKAWQDKYDAALASAKTKRQTDIADYDAQSKAYQDALDKANASRQSIFDKLADDEDNYDPSHTMFTDVKTGDKYLVHPVTGEYKNITQIFKSATQTQKRRISRYIKGFDERLLDTSSGTPKVINAFDEATQQLYHNNNTFNNYLGRVQSSHNADIRNAEKQIQQAWNDSADWTANNLNRPQAWDASVEKQFTQDFKKNNAKPTYSFNGQNYSKESDLDKAYNEALAHEKNMQTSFSKKSSLFASKRDAAIAQRIQDAKDIKKAKLALGAGVGAGALYAGAKALYGGDDTPDNTDNIDNTNNIDTTDNTYTGEPDPNLKIENTSEGKAALNGKSIDTGFDPDKADAVATLAAAAHDKGVEDSNSIESSDDHFIDDDELYGLLKAMQDPYKADAVANYIYSKHGNESDVQNLGWRGWLNKYYGDLLRSRMNIDPSGYKGMHISGGL